MGFVYVDVFVRGIRASRIIRMPVDTGSTYIVLDPRTIDELGLYKTPYTVELTLADRKRVGMRLYLAEVEVKGRRGLVLVAELDTPVPLLGVYALEILGFRANPRTGELEEISPEGRIPALSNGDSPSQRRVHPRLAVALKRVKPW